MPDLPLVEPLLDALAQGQPVPEAVAVGWSRRGLTRFDVLARLALAWGEASSPQHAGDVLLPALLEHVVAAPDPDLALLSYARLQAELGSLGLISAVAEDGRFGHDLLSLLGLGKVASDTLLREPGLADLLLDSAALAKPVTVASLTADVLALIGRLPTQSTRRNALRRWKRGQFLRIMARDWLLSQPQQTITAEISAVADACCAAALEAACQDVLGRSAADTPGLAVIAMGKWGGNELNYNSDIDLICVCRVASGPTAADWDQVVLALSRELDEPTSEGRVFEVDHRLRPDGAGGTLVRSFTGCQRYYGRHAAAWEALALTRARAAVGDPQLGRDFEQLAVETAYGARMRHAGIESLRANRRILEERCQAKRNVKEGPGGIRDVEFSTQLLTLVRGVTDPTVRVRNTWDALSALQKVGAISYTEQQHLGESYDYLRRIEHLLQIQPVAPTKDLPEDRLGLARLARAMGYRDSGPLTAGDRLLADYYSHATRTRELCNQLFYNPIPLSSPDAEARIAELLDPAVADTEAIAHLSDISFAEPAEARRRLLFLAHGEPPMRLSEGAQAKFVEFLPALLGCVQRMPDPDAALRWFERMVARAGGRDLLYQHFLSHPTLIEVMCRIGGYSDYLSQTLVDHPEYLDRMVLASFSQHEPSLNDLLSEIEERLKPLKDTNTRLDDLRRFRRRELFRIGVRDLLGVIDVQQTVAALSDLAEACLRTLYHEVVASLPGADELRFAIIGMGKLGGRELHYSSDLDVLFVYEPGGTPDDAALAQRLAQAIVRVADEPTRAGRLYPLDARLRPYGRNSSLTRTRESYQTYWADHAEPWERLTLTRARFIAGDAALGERFIDAAQGYAFGPPPTSDEVASLRNIKHRVETERLDTTNTNALSLKLQPGGIMDIEFLCQLLQTQAGQTHPASRVTNTSAALPALSQAGYLSAAEADLLRRNYWQLRRTELRLQLVQERPSGDLPLDAAGLTAAAKRLGWSEREAALHPERLVADLRLRLAAVREVVSKHLGL